MTTSHRDDLLATVERSPQAVSAHDRDAWVRLFTDDGRVEDPVGSSPHVGHDQIYRFYDTFIGPRSITFHRDVDIVSGATVLRDLELEVAMGTAVRMYIPAFLRYDLREVNGEWKIAHLRAYWELPAMMVRFLKNGTSALTPGLQLGRELLGNQGPLGAVGFISGFRRAGARHKRLVQGFLRAVAEGDESSAGSRLSSTAAVTRGDSERIDIAELGAQLRGANWAKVIGAGSTVVVSVASDRGRGIVFADVAWRGNQINAVRYFPA